MPPLRLIDSAATPEEAQGRGAPPGAAPVEATRPTPSVVFARVTMADAARTTLAIVGVLAGVYFLWKIQEVLFLLFLAIMLATAIEPIVNRLRRGPFSRGTGVLAVYTTIIVAVGLPAYLLAPGLTGQSAALLEQIPGRIEELRVSAETIQPRFLQGLALSALDQAALLIRPSAPPEGTALVAAGATAAQSAINFVMVFVLALYWLVERATIKRITLRAATPRWAREVNVVWLEIEEKLGGWVRGQLILMLAIGVMAGIGYMVIGLPNALLLGVAAAFGEVVPMIGPFLAFAPAVLVALAVDPSKAILVIGYAIVIQQFESNFLVPRVMGRTVGVSPLTVLLGILVGSVLYGLPGAFLAVPLAGAIQVLLAHLLRSEDSSQAEAHAV